MSAGAPTFGGSPARRETGDLPVRRRIDDTSDLLSGARGLRLGLLLSVLVVVFYTEGFPFRAAIVAVAVPALLLHDLALSPRYWLILALATLFAFLPVIHSADNHQYLIVYWAFAVAIALRADDFQDLVRANARVLIGLCFAFATFWKLISPEFLSGAFFEYIFLTDDRFIGVNEWLFGIPRESTWRNLAGIAALYDQTTGVAAVELVTGRGARATAVALAFWTVAIEGAIAIAFLSPHRSRISRVRDVPLLLFVATTYPIAIVTGFAGLVAALGFVQCDERRRGFRLAYLVAFFVVPLLSILRHSQIYG